MTVCDGIGGIHGLSSVPGVVASRSSLPNPGWKTRIVSVPDDVKARGYRSYCEDVRAANDMVH